MQQLTPDQRRRVAALMRSRRREWRALEARRYPRASTGTGEYIEAFNQLNRNPYRQRVTLDFQN